ncbi:Crp/Fnr family transcriptional regulator [Mucilaginibacter sp. HMF5004]|uniref:Crp/Fnr family transcriptional regulator n=1 Tax=Mucilaginibacter rivuli TaxID=2857527 RepID=UPI001C600B18|nr:Crp/Fnr family transcriptional regulator [Mucilaginibacter rivuli]MBW4889992.1 Crp/Fnr family transcriptional regulator [Mucilaginibacter rivuli]
MNHDLLLANVAKHITLTDEEKAYFISLLNVKKLRKKQYLNQEGDIAKGPSFVNSGILRSYSLDKNGYEHVIQFAPPGWWIGDMASMIKQEPGKLYVDALEDSEVIWIWKADLDKLFVEVPKFERFFRILAENSVATYQSRLVNYLSLPAIERYAGFCKQYPSLIQKLPQKQVASYIGVTPEFLSKMLNNTVI